MIRVMFPLDYGNGYVGGEPGTNFGLRISGAEVRRLEREYGLDNLPFHVMAAGYGDDEDWVGLQSSDFVFLDHDDKLDAFWGPFEIAKHDSQRRQAMTADLPSLFQRTSTTPEQALGAIEARLESYEASVELLPDYLSPEMREAINVLDAFVKRMPDDIEWGETGACLERLANDPDVAAAMDVEGVDSFDATYIEVATRLGYGRHYGYPHCIWCLEAS